MERRTFLLGLLGGLAAAPAIVAAASSVVEAAPAPEAASPAPLTEADLDTKADWAQAEMAVPGPARRRARRGARRVGRTARRGVRRVRRTRRRVGRVMRRRGY